MTFAASGAGLQRAIPHRLRLARHTELQHPEAGPAGRDSCRARSRRCARAVPVLESYLDAEGEPGRRDDGTVRRRRAGRDRRDCRASRCVGCGERRRLRRSVRAVALREATRISEDGVHGAARSATPPSIRTSRCSTTCSFLEPRDHAVVERQAASGRRVDREDRPERARVHLERARVRTELLHHDPDYERHLVGWPGAADDADRPLRHVAHALVGEGGRRSCMREIDHLQRVRSTTAHVYRERIIPA